MNRNRKEEPWASPVDVFGFHKQTYEEATTTPKMGCRPRLSQGGLLERHLERGRKSRNLFVEDDDDTKSERNLVEDERTTTFASTDWENGTFVTTANRPFLNRPLHHKQQQQQQQQQQQKKKPTTTPLVQQLRMLHDSCSSSSTNSSSFTKYPQEFDSSFGDLVRNEGFVAQKRREQIEKQILIMEIDDESQPKIIRTAYQSLEGDDTERGQMMDFAVWPKTI